MDPLHKDLAVRTTQSVAPFMEFELGVQEPEVDVVARDEGPEE